MICLMIVVILWMPYLIRLLLPAAQQVRIPTRSSSPQVRAEPPRLVQGGTGGQAGQSWSALDDHQLTRLLIDSAPGTTSQQDLV